MAYTSGLDKLSSYLSPAIRKMGDYTISFTGTQSQVIRITKSVKDGWAGNAGGKQDVFGDFDQKLEAEVIGNIIIQWPDNKFRLFADKEKKTGRSKAKSITPEENLPIEFFLRLDGSYTGTPVSIQQDDLVIDYIIDENKNIIPLYLEVSQIFASTFGKNLIRKAGNLVPYRGNFEKGIKEKVQYYINQLIAGNLPVGAAS